MTPLQFISEECANHQSDGSCMGAVINDDLSITRCDSKPRCLVAEGKRCSYFEECVAPMVNMVSDPRRAAEIQEAVAEYRQITNQKAPAIRPCPECGGPCQPRKRFCPACVDKRRKAAKRRAFHRARGRGMSTRQLSPKSEAKPQ